MTVRLAKDKERAMEEAFGVSARAAEIKVSVCMAVPTSSTPNRSQSQYIRYVLQLLPHSSGTTTAPPPAMHERSLVPLAEP